MMPAEYVTYESLQDPELPETCFWLDSRDGSTIQIPPSKVSVWENPTANEIRMVLMVSTDLIDLGGNPRRFKAIPRIVVVVPPRGRVMLPKSADRSVHETRCKGVDGYCADTARCLDESHTYRTIVGGLGPQLVKVGATNAAVHPVIAAQNAPPPRTAPVSLADRLAARLAVQS